MSGATALMDTLRRHGVDTIFGYPGGAILPIYDALHIAESEGWVKHILVRHEQAGTHAADAYARATGKVGVCFGTSGPGATNLVTGIATVKIDDPNCLRSGANQAQGVAKDSQVLLPRFVAYDSDDPRTFHTSMIEPPEGENPVKFAHQVTLDMGRFREFC